MLYHENIDNNEFNIFIRNLSNNINSNIKHMIEDHENIKQIEIKDKKNKKNKKKKSETKSEIIQKQNEIRYKKDLDDDLIRINNLKINEINPYENFKLFKTDEIKEKYCFNLLEYYWNKEEKNMELILGLYFQYCNTKNEKHKLLINQINKKLDNSTLPSPMRIPFNN